MDDSTYAGHYPYKSNNGYTSEPERNYDSDYSIKYKTLDRRRNPSTGSSYEQYVFSLLSHPEARFFFYFFFLRLAIVFRAQNTRTKWHSIISQIMQIYRLTARNVHCIASVQLNSNEISFGLHDVCVCISRILRRQTCVAFWSENRVEHRTST